MAVNAFNTNMVGIRQVLGDFTRGHMFRLTIPQLGADNVVSFFARSTELPAFELAESTIAYQSLKMPVATTAVFNQDWNITFLADEAQVLRNRLLSWGQYVYDANRMSHTMPINYMADNVSADQLDRTGNIISTYRFYGLYPKKVSGYKFNHEDPNPQNFDVTFKYTYFTIDVPDNKGDNTQPIVGTSSAGQSPSNGVNKTGVGSIKSIDPGNQPSTRSNPGA